MPDEKKPPKPPVAPEMPEMVVAMPGAKPADPAHGSFTEKSKLHQARVEKSKEPPGLLPRPVTNLFAMMFMVLGGIVAMKLFGIEYGDTIIDYLNGKLNNMIHWWIP